MLLLPLLFTIEFCLVESTTLIFDECELPPTIQWHQSVKKNTCKRLEATILAIIIYFNKPWISSITVTAFLRSYFSTFFYRTKHNRWYCPIHGPEWTISRALGVRSKAKAMEDSSPCPIIPRYVKGNWVLNSRAVFGK